MPCCLRVFDYTPVYVRITDKDCPFCLYSLSDFKCADDGVRSDSNVRERYLRGDLGAVPSPDLSSVFFPEDEGDASSESESAAEPSR